MFLRFGQKNINNICGAIRSAFIHVRNMFSSFVCPLLWIKSARRIFFAVETRDINKFARIYHPGITLLLKRDRYETKPLKCNWNGISYLRFLHNHNVSTLLTSTINFFSPMVCKTCFFSHSKLAGWAKKLAAILAWPQPRYFTGCVNFVPGQKSRAKIRDVGSGLSPRISCCRNLRATRKSKTVSLTRA